MTPYIPFISTHLSHRLQHELDRLETAVRNHRVHIDQLDRGVSDMDDVIHGYELANETLWNTVIGADND
jgi:hypothetical protein